MRQITDHGIELTANPIWNDFERGQWYERRGLLKEALESYRAAAQRVPAGDPAESQQDIAMIWLQYGQLSMRLRSFSHSESAYEHVVRCGGTYAQQALNQWAALLLEQGLSDRKIYERLADETTNLAVSSEMVGRSLFFIGAYQEASECFQSCDNLELGSGLMYSKCLIRLQQISEALQLLHRIESKPYYNNGSPANSERQALNQLKLLCKWRLADASSPAVELHDPLELAEMAIAVGMIPEAERLLSLSGIHASHALICMLYYEGYISEAVSRIKALPELPVKDSGIYSENLCVIAAEVLYDKGNYEEAATLFHQIRRARPSCTVARFGEAACHLQTTIFSLSKRLEASFSSPKLKQEIMQHLDNMVSALHLVESSGWHTTWTPSQKRIEKKPKAPCSSVLLN